MHYRIPTADEFVDYWCAVDERFDDPLWIVQEAHLPAVSRLRDADGRYLYDAVSKTLLGYSVKLTQKLYPIQLVERSASIDYH